MIYGARTAADLVLLDEVRAACAKVILTTEDGSSPEGGPAATHGRVTDALRLALPRRSAPGTRILTCGPNAMMKAVVELTRDQVAGRPPEPVDCLVSVEGEMACGIGACLGCAVACPPGAPRAYRYACVDGPVFDARDVVLP
jgi:dihydroorotate dehydrogenase electron transfer subunit